MKCPICDGNCKIIFQNFFKCDNCFFIFDNSPYEYLPNEYRHYDIEEIYFKSVEKIFNFVIKELANFYPSRGRLLDIGCAYGFFLELVGNNGWEAYGIEVDKKMVEYCDSKNIKVFNSDIEAFKGDEDYDVITFFSVLSLLKNFDLAIKKAAKLLRKNGIIVIRDYNSFFQYYAFKFFSFLSFLNIKPFIFHKWNFSKKSMEILLKKNDFEIIKIINSPLTKGDPYKTGGFLKTGVVSVLKFVCNIISEIVYFMSFKKFLTSSSFIVFARKK